MASGNSLTLLTPQQRTFYVTTLLSRLRPRTPMFGEGRKESIARRQGKTANWRYLAPFPKATTELAEGVKPSVTPLVWTDQTATLKQYGAYATVTDLLVLQGIDPQITEISEAFGENAGQTLHQVLIDVLKLGSPVYYPDGVTSRATVAVANILEAPEIRRARRILAGANVPTFPDGYYHALIHPFAMESLTADPAVTSLASYGAGGISKESGVDLLKGRVMYFGGFKFMESTDAPTFTGGSVPIVYGTMFYGMDWFGEVDLAAASIGTANAETNKLSGIDIKIIQYDQLDRSDPLGQYGTIGWICRGYTAKILEEVRAIRIEHAVAA